MTETRRQKQLEYTFRLSLANVTDASGSPRVEPKLGHQQVLALRAFGKLT